jgi:GNAT superfamily N-acetyltransferase
MDITIRAIRKTDVARLIDVGHSHTDFRVNRRVGFYKKSELITWARRSNEGVFLIAISGKTLLGFVFCKIMSSKWAMIDSLYVLPEFRRKGVGGKLIETCFAQLRNNGIDYVSTLIKPHKRQIRSYMSRNGFRQSSKYLWMGRFIK